VGFVAARRALRLYGEPGRLADAVLVEIVPPSNIAVGTVPWGLSRWVHPGSVHRIGTNLYPTAANAAAANTAAANTAAANTAAANAAAAAAGRPLLVVVRDAHRYPVAQSVVLALLAARPDAVIVEMGLPVWRPPAQAYLATFGATHASSLAAAEMLGLASGPI
jgi:beta-N-acetylhexosaminidase